MYVSKVGNFKFLCRISLRNSSLFVFNSIVYYLESKVIHMVDVDQDYCMIFLWYYVFTVTSIVTSINVKIVRKEY